jgi:DDE domain
MTISFARHQFRPAIIRHAVWLYVRFTLSYRDVEDLLAERGLDVSYETVRRWVLKFGPLFARELRRRRPRPTARWHLDEMALMIAGTEFWLWRAVDDEGEVLDLLVQRRRDKVAAVKVMRKLLKKQRFARDVLGDGQAALLRRGQGGVEFVGSSPAGLAQGREFPSTNTTAGAQDAALSNRRDQPNDFCRFTPPSKILSTSNAISPLAAASASSATRRSRHGELRRLHDPSWDFRTSRRQFRFV